MKFDTVADAVKFIRQHRLKLTEHVSHARGTRFNVVGSLPVEGATKKLPVRAYTLAVNGEGVKRKKDHE